MKNIDFTRIILGLIFIILPIFLYIKWAWNTDAKGVFLGFPISVIIIGLMLTFINIRRNLNNIKLENSIGNTRQNPSLFVVGRVVQLVFLSFFLLPFIIIFIMAGAGL